MFKRDGTYYMAYARGNPATGGNPATYDYATASNPLGPWTYRGRILDTVTNTTTNHAAIVEFKGQWYVVYHNGALPGGGEFRRSVSVDKLFFNPDGTIQKVVADAQPARRSRRSRRSPTCTSTAPASSRALPRGRLWNMYDFTCRGVGASSTPRDPGQRIFDFGASPNVAHVPDDAGPAGDPRFAITTSGAGGERRIDGTAPLPDGPLDARGGDQVRARRAALRQRRAGRPAHEPRALPGPPRQRAEQLDRPLAERRRPVLPGRDGRLPHLPARPRARPRCASWRRSRPSASGEVGGTVPATLSLTRRRAPSFGAFQPGVAREYRPRRPRT